RFRGAEVRRDVGEDRPEGRSVPGVVIVGAPDLIDDALDLAHQDAARIPSPSGDGGMAALLLRERTRDDPIAHMPTVIRTICCNPHVPPEQAAAIDEPLDRYADACNAIADVCRALGSTNRVEVHRACYREIRQRSGLAANHVVRAIARACIALKVPEKADSTFR